MKGWERVGRVNDAYRIELEKAIGADDLLAFAYADDVPLRHGWLRASAALPKTLVGYGIVAEDIVYRATALGENAFKRGERCDA